MLAKRLIVFGACLLCGAALRAEEDLPSVSASGAPLEQVVVTSEPPKVPKIDRQIFADGPVEMQIIGAEEIRRMPATNVADVVRKLPGIRVQQRVQGERAAVSIEGMPPTYTSILVDGQPYSGELGDVHDLRDIPLANVERIEVTRAAGALQYGPEAAGGVINVVTRAPPREGWYGELRGGWGSDDKILTLSSLGVGNERLGGTVSFAHDQQDGFDSPDDLTNAMVPGSGGPDARTTSRDLLATLDVSPTQRLDLRTRAGWRLQNDDMPVHDDGDDFMTGTNYQRWLALQEAGYELGPRARVDAVLRWFQGDTDSQIGREFQMDEDEYGLQLSARAPLDFHRFENGLTFGVDAKRPQLQLDEGPPEFEDPQLSSGDVNEHFEMAGFFAIVDTQVLDWVSLQTGVRSDVHSEFDPSFSPQVALTLTPWLAEGERFLKLRFSFGHSNRSPSLRDLYQPPAAQLQGAYFLAGRRDLSPESSSSYRAGFEFQPFTPVSLSAIGFWNDIDDHIRSSLDGSVKVGEELIPPQFPPDTRPGLELICRAVDYQLPECGTPTLVERFSPLFRKTNLDKVRTRGVEAHLLWTPHPRFDLRFGYTFLDTKVIDSNLVDIDELPNEAPHTVDGRVSFEIPLIDTRITGQVAWRDAALTELSGTGSTSFVTGDPGHHSTIVDFRVSRAVPFLEGLELSADLYNATDERVVDSYVVRGRTLFLSVYGRLP